MKKKLLLLLTLPLIVACGSKNKDSQSETSASNSEYSTSIGSEESSSIGEDSSLSSEDSSFSSEDSSSSSEDPEVPEYPDIGPKDLFDPSCLNQVSEMAISLVANEAFSNTAKINSIKTEYGEGEDICSDDIYDYLNIERASYRTEISEHDYYSDDLARTSKGSFAYYENLGQKNEYYYGYDFVSDCYYTTPDESNHTTSVYYERQSNGLGHERIWDYYGSEDLIMTIDNINFDLKCDLYDCLVYANDVFTSSIGPEMFYGEKDGLYYLGSLSKIDYSFEAGVELNFTFFGVETTFIELITIRNDENLGFVLDSYCGYQYSYFFNDIFGNQFEEGILNDYSYMIGTFNIKDLGTYVRPIIPESLINESNASFSPLLNFFEGNGPFTSTTFYCELYYCGKRNGLETYGITISLSKDDKISISNYDNQKNGIALLNNINVNLHSTANYIEPYSDEAFKNIYIATDSVRLNMLVMYDVETSDVYIDASFVSDNISVF